MQGKGLMMFNSFSERRQLLAVQKDHSKSSTVTASAQSGMNQTDLTDILKGGSTTAAVSGTYSVASTTPSPDNATTLGQVISTTTASQRTGLTPSQTSTFSVFGTGQITETSRVAAFHYSSTSLGSTSSVSSKLQATTSQTPTPSPEAKKPATTSHTTAPAQGSPAAPAECCPPTVTSSDGAPHTQADVQPTQPHNDSLTITMVAFGMMIFILILIVITVILVTAVNLKGRCSTPKDDELTTNKLFDSNTTTNGDKDSITLVSIKTINTDTDSHRFSSVPSTTLDVENLTLRQDLLNTKLV
ncbi:endothelial cell-specific chemotaxis regulator isoform X2 [Hypomesus transpacificus]|uniref:endothelial cell-specific chemotaxis regulator isoform X2 n=1 Tax=Hypomesus transpacificus TaxID=137520 RepID=UPI001F0723AB|nr:endothelial cell-specific chemotaxis regulator isoform X2 [Hypomesus transpacificus]